MLKDWLTASARTLGQLRDARTARAPIVFLDQRWSHHGRHSGYLVADGVGPVLPRDVRALPYPIVRRWIEQTGDDASEVRMILQLMLQVGGAQLLHVVDGDFDTWMYEKRAPFLTTRMTATFHQTVDVLQARRKHMKAGVLDGIVCVSRNQVPLLEDLVPRGRCVFVPHGVDTEFFHPAATPPASEKPVLLAVGAHRRDFATLVQTAKLIKEKRPDAVVRLIGPADKVTKLHHDGVLEIVTGVSDPELRRAYQTASCLLLPLEEATANNALLESMACARPAVITDLPALHDYTAADAAFFCPRGDAGAHADAALRLLGDDVLRERMGQAAHERAQRFAWSGVRADLSAFLKSVAAT